MLPGRWQPQGDRILPHLGASFSDFYRLPAYDAKVILVIAGETVVG
jgi:hypothetical protein